MNRVVIATAAGSLFAAAGSAAAQSDPSGFGTVYNIGDVPSGSIFDVPGAVAGQQVGDGDGSAGEAFITPMFLGGDILGSDSQLNVFDGGNVLAGFSAGPVSGGTNIELNVLGGTIGDRFRAFSGSTVNLFGGSIGANVFAGPGSVINVAAGSIGSGLTAFSSTINISDGSFGGGFEALSSSTLTIAGGDFTEVLIGQGSTATITGGSFAGIRSDGSTLELSGASLAGGLEAAMGVVSLADSVIEGSLELGDGAQLNMTSGVVRGSSRVDPGAAFSILGGALGQGFDAASGSAVTISGGLFQFNGVNVSDVPGGVAGGSADLLSGVLPNGRVFILSGEVDRLAAGTVTLDETAVVPSTNPGTLSSGTFDKGLRTGETLTLDGNGQLGEYFAAVGAALSVEGGSVGRGLEVAGAGSSLQISGGTLEDVSVFAGGTLDISGGLVNAGFLAGSGVPVTISGGVVSSDGRQSRAADTTVDISGGSVASLATVNSAVSVTGGSVTTIVAEGGTLDISNGFVELARASAGAVINVSGGGFGSLEAASGATLNVFDGGSGDRGVAAGTGATINISNGSSVSGFLVNGATANVSEGSSVGSDARSFGGIVNISGGATVGGDFFVEAGSTVNLSDGSIGSQADVVDSTLNVSDGVVGRGALVFRSELNLSGGSIDGFLLAAGGSTVNVSGGSIGESASFFNSELNLIGTSFLLDGVELTDLVFGEAFVIAERDVSLAGVLADGTAFDFDLTLTDTPHDGLLNGQAVVTVTLVPAPSGVVLAVLVGGVVTRRRR